ncbi:MAG: ADP-forming succinate--CoA ligase subunit beta [Desulfobulbaceae bacterium]|nr:ADP-forming succinate--CoA ligase subunit beta [Desulfobulbaceae bacterium]
MKLHEYQAKELFRSAGIAVPEGLIASTVQEAEEAANRLAFPVVVKAQVHAGGRGKAGGIKVAHSMAELRQAAEEILGMNLQTAQTGSQTFTVSKVLVEQGVAIERELYLSILPDRTSAGIAIIASSEGGMNIEEVAAADPDRIIRIMIDPLLGVQPFHLRQAGFGLGLQGELLRGFSSLLAGLYRLVIGKDLLLAEINPLVITTDRRIIALDGKVEVDGSALFRHPEMAAMKESENTDPLEAEAARHNLNYINLNGNIGNMVNGAGLAMATMDIIKLAGAEPANFLDVGGGANADMIENGFRIILSDARVKGILINIFGGILRCDVLARGVVEAAGKVGLRVPVVIRMEGTNEEEGRRILAESGLDLITARDLNDAATKISAIAARP